MKTKEKIIYQSLNLFSIRGYGSVSIRDIAKSVGIKGSSIYNHFKSKQDIFDTIVKKYSENANKFLENIYLSNKFIDLEINDVFDEKFLDISIEIFKFYLEDPYIIKFRQMLKVEQLNNKKVAELYQKIFIDDILNTLKEIFLLLIKKNIFVNKDPYVLALEFYSPVFLLFYKYKRVTNDEIEALKKHIIAFKDTYAMKG